MFVSFNSNATSTTGGAGKLLTLPEHTSSPTGFCVCFTSITAMLYERSQNVEQELLSFPEHLRFF